MSHAEEISKQNKALSCGSTEAVAQRCSVKNGVLGKFAKFTEKHLRQGLFLEKVAACNFIKKKLWDRCFPVDFAKFLGTSFLTERRRWLLLHLVSGSLNIRICHNYFIH